MEGEIDRLKKINRALYNISNAVSTTENLYELYEIIHYSLAAVINVNNFYIAIYDESEDGICFPYCRDEIDGQLPPVKNISQSASLTAKVIKSGLPLLITKDEIIEQRRKSGLLVPTCTPSEIWMGVPLKSFDRIIGVIAVQSYTDPDLYNETDMEMMISVADHLGVAIERKRSEENRELLIKELQKALEDVKTLQGIIPICSHCKNIRDDKGYWNLLEAYIQKHSDAFFSHGVCPDCIKKFYPDMDE